MAGINYPSPCEKCPHSEDCSGSRGYCGCDKWRTWFCWWWKRFKVLLLKPAPKKNAWRYYHPDEVIQIVEHPPCEKCLRKECDKPCKNYLSWYDMRMEIARKKAGL